MREERKNSIRPLLPEEEDKAESYHQKQKDVPIAVFQTLPTSRARIAWKPPDIKTSLVSYKND